MGRGDALLVVVLVASGCVTLAGQEHAHHHDAKTRPAVERVFLDKSPRIIWYQLNRLPNERLLMVERSADDPQYEPVYLAILTRAGLSQQHREEALQALVRINKSDATTELLTVLGNSDPNVALDPRVARQLATLLLQQPRPQLIERVELLKAATNGKSETQRAAGCAGLVLAGEEAQAEALARSDSARRLDYLAAVALIPDAVVRSRLRPTIVDSLSDSQPTAIRNAALQALAALSTEFDETFRLAAPFVGEADFRTAAVRTLLAVPDPHRDPATAEKLVAVLVQLAESTPAEERTRGEFVDAMQLADQLLTRLPDEARRTYRQRLQRTVVRVVRIRTVEEEMRYDTPYFAVEAGRPVQVVLQNEDLMPHNLVITTPGSLQEVALAGALVPEGTNGKQYVPDSNKVLFATNMVPADRQERLTFTAPSETGEYPYVCTFPRHWMRMYGVMVVVADLDKWLQDPQPPADPTGNNRSFVQSWTLADVQPELMDGLRGRSAAIGARIFQEATCAQCHKMHGQGGAVGPELTDVLQRWKGDQVGILREILDPSYKIDPQYAVQTIALADGRVVSGIVKSEDQQSLVVIVNPESPTPTVIRRAEIDDIVKSTKSMMPKALLDRFSKDEIFELVSYLTSATPAPVPVE